MDEEQKSEEYTRCSTSLDLEHPKQEPVAHAVDEDDV